MRCLPARQTGRDPLKYAGVLTMAHEIGHVLGLQHTIGEPCFNCAEYYDLDISGPQR